MQVEQGFEHYDGGDVNVVDVRDPRRCLPGVTEVIVTGGHAVVMLGVSSVPLEELTMSSLGYQSPEETPAYMIRSRATDEQYWCGPVRLALI